MSNQKQGVVNIRGKEYKTVALRVAEFRADEQYAEYCMYTDIIEMDNIKVVVRCRILDKNDRTVSTGHAEEFRTSGNINRTSALENCETSAIGRALAALGLGGTEFASADEVAGAIQQQSKASPVQVAALEALLSDGVISTQQLVSTFGHCTLSELLSVEADRVINAVQAAQTTTGET